MGSRASAPLRRDRQVEEPCRYDLREHACFPYPPVENQGGDVTCVAHAFAMALYCSAQTSIGPSVFSYFENIFDEALSESPDRERGVSFDAVARGTLRRYGSQLRSLGRAFRTLPNDAELVRAALLEGAPVIAGYQVDENIDNFHRDAHVCEQVGYMLPHFSEDSITGHAVLLLGYDFRVQAFIARNSWGEDWGVQGHFLVPFACIEDPEAVTDLWALVPT